jgi:hypothetical protein
LLLATTGLASATAFASSHREAPAISKDPAADITDLYAFKAPGDATRFAIIMNVSPAQVAYAGPNWYQFDDDVIYEIHVDNTGDAIEDITYRFQFKTADYRALDNDHNLIVANFPKITFANGKYDGALSQTYSVTKVVGNRRTGTATSVVANVPVAPPRIGPHTTDYGTNVTTAAQQYANYNTNTADAIKTEGTAKFFAGPRNDPFFVDLGAVFDRVAVRTGGAGGYPNTGTAHDSLEGSNVLTIAMEVPVADIKGDGDYFGVWATTSRPQAKVLRTGGQGPSLGGGYVQVSRLGNPLVNEVVIKMTDKDKFNATEPKDDATNFAAYVTKPQLAYVLNVLYGATNSSGVQIAADLINPIDEDNRTDLVAAFVTGIPNVNKHPSATATGGDMIRVNLGLADAQQHWPLSGRQLKDDVVASALSFLAQCDELRVGDSTGLGGFLGAHSNPYGKTTNVTGGSPNKANCYLDDFISSGDDSDGATAGSHGVISTFPYVDAPFSSFLAQ